MVGACLVPLMALALAISPDAASLVARLGSGTVAEREESARALEAMGREALPALEAALRSPDAEARARVLSVWERVQKGLMVRATMVRLDGGRRPLTEVLRSIGERSGFTLEFMRYGEEPPLIDAREPAPIPFWEAVERLCRGPYFGRVLPSGRGFPVVEVASYVMAYPATVSGPFRIMLEGIHDHRDRLLIAGPWLGMDDMNPEIRIQIPRTAREREARFYIDLAMMVEPRMWFTHEGPARAIEAVDDLGQSLVRRETTRVVADPSVSGNSGGVTRGHFQLDLAMPEKPGRTIVRLQGSIPVALQVRRPVPALEVSLADSTGRTIAHEDADFTIRDFREDAQGTWIGVEVRINLDRFELPAGRDGWLALSRLNCLMNHQVEIVDADGRFLAEAGAGSASADGHSRRTFVVPNGGKTIHPMRLRYYRMVRAFTDVAFEFRNIPMP